MTGWLAALSLSALLTASSAHAQTAPPAFDVASVKPNPNCQTGSGRAAISPRNLALPCVPLRALIRLAYGDMLSGTGLGPGMMQVEGGPGWIDTDRFDLLAKSDDSAGGQSAVLMLRTLLEERFHVKVHKEARESSVYTLTVAKGGSKLEPTKEGSCTEMDLNNLQQAARPKPGEAMPRICGTGGGKSKDGAMSFDYYGVTMSELGSRILRGYADRPVLDTTGLTGRFDIHLEFVPDKRPPGPAVLNGAAAPELAATEPEAGRSLFTALEKQLGLKLSPGKAPLEVIIVDHAEKPSAN
jgi:uncharacterized protein (TIGR03435 family)